MPGNNDELVDLSGKMIDEEPGIPDDMKEQVKTMVREGVSVLDEAMQPFIQLFNARLANMESTAKAQAELITELAKSMGEFERFAWEFKRDMLDIFVDTFTVLKQSGGQVPDHYIPNLTSQIAACKQALAELGQ